MVEINILKNHIDISKNECPLSTIQWFMWLHHGESRTPLASALTETKINKSIF
jgi:hypothetical protein